MSAYDALTAARAAGVKLWIEHDALKMRAKAKPPQSIIDNVRKHKPGIRQLLLEESRQQHRTRAERFLVAYLTEPTPVTEIRAAAERAGLAWRTVERAKVRVGIRATRPVNPGPWFWSLDGPMSPDEIHAAAEHWETDEGRPLANRNRPCGTCARFERGVCSFGQSADDGALVRADTVKLRCVLAEYP